MNSDLTPWAASRSSWKKLVLATGAAAFLCYFLSSVFRPFPREVGRLLFFAVGPLYVISSLGLYHVFRGRCSEIPLKLAALFNIFSGLLMNAMAVVQTTQFTLLGRQIREAPDEAVKEMLTRILWGVNVVQSGLDISWDIFISLGVIFLGIALTRHALFGAVWGGAGAVIAASALCLNMITFPVPPAEAGLIDLGPAFGLWYGAVMVRLAFSRS